MTKYMLVCLTIAAGTTALSPVHAADDTTVGILAGLGLTAASGKTEMGDGAGSLEGTALTLAPAKHAGEKIAEIVARQQGFTTAAVVGGDKKVSFAAYSQASNRLDRVADALESFQCGRVPKPGSVVIAPLVNIDDSPVGIANAAIGALKIDTSVKGFDVSGTDILLINAIAAKLATLSKSAILPEEAGSGDYAGPLATRFNDISDKVETLEGCIRKLGKKAAENEVKRLQKLRGALDSLTESKDATPSLLEDAIALEPIAINKPWTLRVNTMKAGGNIITRSNIFFQFGFPGAVALRGGIVANWRLSNPKAGTIVAAGTVSCVTAERNFSSITSNSSPTPEIWCADENGQFKKER